MALTFRCPDLELLPTLVNRRLGEWSTSDVRMSTWRDERLMSEMLTIQAEGSDTSVTLRIPDDVVYAGEVLVWIASRVREFRSDFASRERIDGEICSEGEFDGEDGGREGAV